MDSFGASCNEANSHLSHLYVNASCKDVLHVFGWKDAMDWEMDNLQGKSLVTCYLLFGRFFFLAQVVHQGTRLYSPASRLLNIIDLLVCF